jgi:ABC-type proline/glycine betaine transport system substrate-binding protein
MLLASIAAAMTFIFLIFASTSNAATKRITLTDNSMVSIQVHNKIVVFILEHGYCCTVNYVFAETLPIHLDLQRRDMDANIECMTRNYGTKSIYMFDY